MKLLENMSIKNERLQIGGVDAGFLREKYGTPLYVMDEGMIREQCQLFQRAFASKRFKTKVLYASKAFLSVGMANLVAQEGLGLDIVSGGELYVAAQSQLTMEEICFHGNNKSDEELAMAVDYHVGTLVLDHQEEAEALERMLAQKNRRMDVLLRLIPSIDAHTHPSIKTAHQESKFGMAMESQETMALIERLQSSQHLNLLGFHCHIGSQIFEEEPYMLLLDKMRDFAFKVKAICGFEPKVLNLGGGFGIYYSSGDEPLEIAEFLPRWIARAEEILGDSSAEELWIEPGRSIVGNAGVTLYTVGGVKKTQGGTHYVLVDGGMTDNPRPSLYQANYECALAEQMMEKDVIPVCIAGKCCESGDILIQKTDLPLPKRGDLLCIPSTGAYHYSMASNYNRLRIPAMVFVNKGQDQLHIKRQSMQQMIENEVR